MTEQLMLLPSQNVRRSKVLRIPADYSDRDAIRLATALIAEMQEEKSEWDDEEIVAHLEAHGFQVINLILGPGLD
jgi:hypothetical protein